MSDTVGRNVQRCRPATADATAAINAAAAAAVAAAAANMEALRRVL